MIIQGSDRLSLMGSAIFAEVAQWKAEARENGLDVIDLGIGSPDRPPSPNVIRALQRGVGNPANYRYPDSQGTIAFRRTVAKWYERRFRVELDAESEVLTLMGSQDGLAHLAMAVANPGELALAPNPGYPIYAAGLALAGLQTHFYPLRAEHGFLPQLEAIPEGISRRAKIMILNYPNNPLAVMADRAFFEKLVSFARTNDLLIVHDLAYSEMAFDGNEPVSVLEIPGAKDVAVEFHSLSKSYNMAGCRIGYLVGNADVVRCLHMLKANIDYGVFLAVQEAGIAALEEDMSGGGSVAALYQRRRDIVVKGLRSAGWSVPKPQATMFIWAPIPAGWTSRQISREMLLRIGVAVIPGDAFGSEGEGYVRIALVQEEARLEQAVERIARFLNENK